MVQADIPPGGSTEKSPDHGPCANTDRHIWPIVSDEQFPPRLHITKDGALGINVGGTVYVKTIQAWHALASDSERSGDREVETKSGDRE